MILLFIVVRGGMDSSEDNKGPTAMPAAYKIQLCTDGFSISPRAPCLFFFLVGIPLYCVLENKAELPITTLAKGLPWFPFRSRGYNSTFKIWFGLSFEPESHIQKEKEKNSPQRLFSPFQVEKEKSEIQIITSTIDDDRKHLFSTVIVLRV